MFNFNFSSIIVYALLLTFSNLYGSITKFYTLINCGLLKTVYMFCKLVLFDFKCIVNINLQICLRKTKTMSSIFIFIKLKV